MEKSTLNLSIATTTQERHVLATHTTVCRTICKAGGCLLFQPHRKCLDLQRFSHAGSESHLSLPPPVGRRDFSLSCLLTLTICSTARVSLAVPFASSDLCHCRNSPCFLLLPLCSNFPSVHSSRSPPVSPGHCANLHVWFLGHS